jgi:predicted Zn-dependent protease
VLKRPLAAAIEYRKAIAAHPDQGPLLVGRLARVLLDMGKHAEALEYVTPALSSWPDHAPLYILAGRAHVAAARPKQALDALDAAAWLNPYDPELHALAAQAYTVLGQTADAAAARAREGLVGSLAP